jgi:hypothetical protein
LDKLATLISKLTIPLQKLEDRLMLGSVLHNSAKYDARREVCVTEWLLKNYKLDPNIANEHYSCPLFWLCVEIDAKPLTPNTEAAARALIKHRKFDTTATYGVRGTVDSVIECTYGHAGEGTIHAMVSGRKIYDDNSARRLVILTIRHMTKTLF